MEHRDKLRVGYEGRSNTINVFKPSLTIPKLVKQSHELAKEKGFWDNPKELGTSLMLIVTELAEAFETFRCADKPENIFPTADTLSQVEKIQNDKKFFKAYQEKIKGSFPEEIADTFIRLADLVGRLQTKHSFDLDRHIKLKYRFNKQRDRLHGKNF